MAFSLFLGGIFNATYLGIPYYIWIMVFVFIIAALIGALFYFFFWWKLKPYHGLFWAHLRKTGASEVFDENMHFDLITERSSKVIFNETFKEAQDAEDDHTESPTGTIGNVRMDFVFDPDKWTYPNSPQHKIIENVAEKHNDMHPDDQIRTLIKFSRYLHEGKLNDYAEDMKGLKRTFLVPWSRIKMMYKDREESDTFGFASSLSKIIAEIENDSYNKYGLMILGFFGLLDLIIIGAHFFMVK